MSEIQIIGISVTFTLIAFLGVMYMIGRLYFELDNRIINLKNQISKHSSINDFPRKKNHKGN